MGSRNLVMAAWLIVVLGAACSQGSTPEATEAPTPESVTTEAPDRRREVLSSRNEVDSGTVGDESAVSTATATATATSAEAGPTLVDLDASTAAMVTLLPAQPGDVGPDVLALQERLAELGFSPGTPDADYGQGTTAAVEAFQMVVGLPQTGVADPATVLALIDYRYDGLVLQPGDEGADVRALQERLQAGPFDPGEPDAEYGTRTVQAVWALEKLAGIPVDGAWGPLDEWAWDALADGRIGRTERDHEVRWIEVDLSAQLFKIYDPESATPVLISHVSSGSRIPWKNEDHSGSSITPTGDFHIYRRISGWRESSLNIGRLYNPLYFTGGIAFHGAQSVPLYPASHGCVRVPMHIADYLPAELPDGTPVHVEA